MRYAVAIAAIALFFLPLGSSNGEPATAPTIRLSDETTFIKAPLKSDGTIDYPEVLDSTQREGVTPENNFFIPILMAIGTSDKTIPIENKTEILKRLGLGNEPGKENFRTNNNQETINQAEDDVIAASEKPWMPEQHKLAAKWIADDAEVINLYIEASNRSRYYWPVVPIDGLLLQGKLPALGRVRSLSNLVAARAMLRLSAGAVDECISDIIAVHRTGRLLTNASTTIEYLVGQTIDALGCKLDRALVASGKMSAKQAKDYLESWQKMPQQREPFEIINTWERFMFLDGVMSSRKQALDKLTKQAGRAEVPAAQIDEVNLNYESILKRGNGIYNLLVDAVRQKDRQKKKELFDQYLKQIELAKDDAQNSKEFGAKISGSLIAIILPGIDRFAVIVERSQTEADVAYVGIALAAYHGDNKAYPDSIKALAPNYLKKIPDDRFANASLVYKKKENGFVLYSIGSNLQDDGGIRPPADKRDEGDIVLETDK